ncbi:MAG: F0F1 ATP synthase subunit C [Erysipelotrichales bacterium]|nr:F0F1 ATP synthase subunit C [Erysipelotrichales bacterium]
MLNLISLVTQLDVGTGLAIIGAGLAVFTGFGSGIAEGNVAAHAMDAIGRNPEATNNIRSNMILGIALAETTGIYGFAIAILVLIMVLF